MRTSDGRGKHLRSRGFIALPIGAYAAIGAAVAIAVLGIAVKVQTSRLDACKADHAAFVAMVKLDGERAEKLAKERELADKKKKETADADLNRARSDLAGVVDAYRSLREQRSAGFRGLPSTPASSNGPARTCFDSAEFQRTMERLDGGGAAIAQEGDQARIGLDAAKRWAQP